MKNLFEFFNSGNKKPEKTEEEKADLKIIEEAGKEHYDRIGDEIEKEISEDFNRAQYNKEKVPAMLNLIKESIKENPKDLFEKLSLDEFLDILSDIYKSEKYNDEDREKMDQFLRDVYVYETTYSEVYEGITVEQFLNFLSKLNSDTNSLLNPEKI